MSQEVYVLFLDPSGDMGIHIKGTRFYDWVALRDEGEGPWTYEDRNKDNCLTEGNRYEFRSEERKNQYVANILMESTDKMECITKGLRIWRYL